MAAPILSLRIKTRVFTELAWHSLFIRTLLIRPETSELANFVPELTIIDLPSFRRRSQTPRRAFGERGCDRFRPQDVLIGGSYYAAR